MKTDISIIIANFNRAETIERAIRSCQNQLITNTTIEIIVVDDGSKDDSLKKLAQFSNEIKIIVHKNNIGVGAASSTGLANAKGKYFIRVDSDDYLSNYFCLIHKSILDSNTNLSFSYSDILEVNEFGEKLNKISLAKKSQLYKHGAGVMFLTAALREIGGYDKKFRNAEDFDLFLRLEKKQMKGYHVPIPLYRYYKHSGNLTKKKERHVFWDLAKKKNNV